MALGTQEMAMLFRIRADSSDAEAKLKKLSKSVDSTFGASFGPNLGANLMAEAISILTGALRQGASAVLNYSARMEQTKVGFTALVGNAKLAEKTLKDLQDFAKTTPFEFEGLAAASRRFIGAGVAVEKILPLMKDLGNAVAATGDTSIERFNGISLAITQMISKTKVSAEEMEQLAERGVPAWKILSDATGKTQQELRKLSEQGKLTSDVMVTALQKMSREKWGDAMQKQSNTFTGSMTIIQDSIMQTAATAFAPLFREITKFSSEYAKSLTENKENTDDFGKDSANILTGVIRLWKEAGKAAEEYGITAALAKLNPDVKVEGSTETRSALSLAMFGGGGEFLRQYGKNKPPEGEIGLIVKNLKDAKEAADDLPDINKLLNAGGAEEETKTLTKIIDDLRSKVAFFGQESENAAVRQQLLNAGVYDLNSELAKSALWWANLLDKQVAAKKAQDEYNAKLKESTSYMSDLREQSRFNAEFPNATPLQQFDFWAKKNAESFQDLKFEIEATRRAIESQAWAESWKGFTTATKDAFATLDNELLRFRESDQIEDFLADFARRVNLVGDISKTTEQNAQDFALKTKAYFDEAFNTSDMDARYEALQKLGKYLQNLQGSSPDGKEAFTLFGGVGSEKIQDFIEKLKALSEAVKSSALTKGLEKLDGIFESLNLRIGGVGAESPLEKLNKMLADPTLTAAINARAAALGYTAEQLKELLRQAAEGDPSRTRERVVPGEEKELSPLEQTFKTIKDFLESNTIETLGDAFADLGNIAVNAFSGMANAIGGLIENWILYGETGPAVMRKILASALATIAAESAVRAIYELAAGFASLFFNPAESAAHFKAAALFGSVAIGAGLAGRAIAGDAFKRETSPGANTGTASGGSNGQSGGAYSGQSDGTIDANRNNPYGTVGQTFEFNIRDKSGMFKKVFEIEFVGQVEGNTKVRKIIKKLAN